MNWNRSQSIYLLGDDEKRLVKFNTLTVFTKNFFNHARFFGFDLIKKLHCFNNAKGLTHFDGIANIDEVW